MVAAYRTSTPSTENDQPESLGVQWQYVWSARYVDAALLRDRNRDGNSQTGDLGKLGSGLEERFYYLGDANFNVTCLVGTDGDPLEHYLYDPYGKLTIYTANWASPQGTSSYGPQHYYTGRKYDGTTRLYHYRNRHYHAELGRFLSRDTEAVDVRQVPLYQYCGGNPTTSVDPSGTATVTIVSTDTTDNDAQCWMLKSSAGTVHIGIGTDINKFGDEKIADILESNPKCIDTLNISGHGFGGSGISMGNDPSGVSTGFSERSDPAVLCRVERKLCRGATVNLWGCSTGFPGETLQEMANHLQSKVCGCTGKAWFEGPYGSAAKKYCDGPYCEGSGWFGWFGWKCKKPNGPPPTQSGETEGAEKCCKGKKTNKCCKPKK